MWLRWRGKGKSKKWTSRRHWIEAWAGVGTLTLCGYPVPPDFKEAIRMRGARNCRECYKVKFRADEGTAGRR